jgi:predicted phosphodiesterase
MKIRFVTDVHALTEAYHNRSGRIPEMGIPILRETMSTAKQDGVDKIISGGDCIQVQCNKPAEADIEMLGIMRDVFNEAGLPVYHVLGNHDIERTGGIKGASEILKMDESDLVISEHGHAYTDTADGHRLIILQEEFKDDPRGTVLNPWSEHAMAFLEEKLATAPSKSVTVFSHTPCDDFDWQEMSTIMRAFDFRNAYRENSSDLRAIMEESGKNILFVSGHTHIDMQYSHKNVRYLTVGSPVEKISGDKPTPSQRFCDIERIGEDTIKVQIKGHAPHEFTWGFDNDCSDNFSLAIAAE